MGRKKWYLTLDTETATLAFADQIAKNAKEKQSIAIAKPLVYDIGWVITDRLGNVAKKENFLVQETFFVPNIFNTAYYRNKRPIYMNLLEAGEIKTGTWDKVINVLMDDLEGVSMVTAYNAAFDFKKAIPFTEKYIRHLYSADYNEWEIKQKKKCKDLIKKRGDDNKNPDYLKPYFKLRGKEYPICDLWGVACDRLINIDRYRNYCNENGLFTASGTFFKSSAETSFQYLLSKHDFVEDHTALSDAEIEAQILTKALKKGRIDPTIKPFPFRELGTTYDYALTKKPKYKNVVRNAIYDYMENAGGFAKAAEGGRGAGYWKRLENILELLY